MICKILYIQDGVEEKTSSMILETASQEYLSFACSFTVVKDGFIGLECLQFHTYDVLIIQKQMPFFNSESFCAILDHLNIHLPIILLSNPMRDGGYINIARNPVIVLSKPFTSEMLCDGIQKALNFSYYITYEATDTIEELPQFDQSFLSINPPEDVLAQEEEEKKGFNVPLSLFSLPVKEDSMVRNYTKPKRGKRSDVERYCSSMVLFGSDVSDNASIADSLSEMSSQMMIEEKEDFSEWNSLACEPIAEENEMILQQWRDMLH